MKRNHIRNKTIYLKFADDLERIGFSCPNLVGINMVAVALAKWIIQHLAHVVLHAVKVQAAIAISFKFQASEPKIISC